MVHSVQNTSNSYPSQQLDPKNQSGLKVGPFQNTLPEIANEIFYHVIALDAGRAPVNARNWLLTCRAFATQESRIDLHQINEMLADETFTDTCLQHQNQSIAALAHTIKQIHPVKDLSFGALKMAASGQTDAFNMNLTQADLNLYTPQQLVKHSEEAKTWLRWLLDTDKFQSKFPIQKVVDACELLPILGQSAERFILRHLDQLPVATLCQIINVSSPLVLMEVKQRLQRLFQANSFQPYESLDQNVKAAQRLLILLNQEATTYITGQIPHISVPTLCRLVTEDKYLSRPAQTELNQRLKKNSEALFKSGVSKSELVLSIKTLIPKMEKPKYAQRFVEKYLHFVDDKVLWIISQVKDDPFARQAFRQIQKNILAGTSALMTNHLNYTFDKNDFRNAK